MRFFLEDGDVPLAHNATEQSIRPFYVREKARVWIDANTEADTNTIIYGIA